MKKSVMYLQKFEIKNIKDFFQCFHYFDTLKLYIVHGISCYSDNKAFHAFLIC